MRAPLGSAGQHHGRRAGKGEAAVAAHRAGGASTRTAAASKGGLGLPAAQVHGRRPRQPRKCEETRGRLATESGALSHIRTLPRRGRASPACGWPAAVAVAAALCTVLLPGKKAPSPPVAPADGCSNTPPAHLQMLNDTEEPLDPVHDKPRMVLRAPCLLSSFERVVRKYKPTGAWYYKKDITGVSVEIMHLHEAPIFMTSGIRDNSTIVDFLQDNILPFFGRMTDITYDWYIPQEQGLVWVLSSSDEQLAKMRPAMLEVGHRFRGKYLVTYTEPTTHKEWIESEFGVTSFPSVVVQREATGRYFVHKGVMTVDAMVQFIHDVHDGCLGYEPWRSLNWQRTTGAPARWPTCALVAETAPGTEEEAVASEVEAMPTGP